jgi:uncharacterized repeat protein (TIGR01451 family)
MKRRQVLVALAALIAGLVLTGVTVGFPAFVQASAASPQVSVLPGFHVSAYYTFTSYTYPTSIAFGPDGKLYVASLTGYVYALEDTDGDNVADSQITFASGLPLPLGLAWQGDGLFVSVNEKIQALEDTDSDEIADQTRDVVTGLPTGGSHRNNGIAFGPDGKLYVTMGSTCNACNETDPRRATILQFDLDGGSLDLGASDTYATYIYAMGVRNAYDLAFYPGTSDLFATDNGRDDLGPDAPPEELNHVVQGVHYGWPHCWAGGSDPGWEVYCTWARQPVATFDAHASADGFAFYDAAEFSPQYWNDAFVALFNAGRVDWVDIVSAGGSYAATVSTFATGFDQPLDIAVGPDGALYVADYGDGTIYRIAAEADLSGSSKAVSNAKPSPGETLTYTLLIANAGSSTAFTLTDSIPISTTYVPGSAWASAGTITDVAGITWSGTVSANVTISATFDVVVDSGIDSPTAIVNTAVLTGGIGSPHTLQATAIISGTDRYFPLVLRE